MKLSDLAKGAARRAAMILPAALLASLLITGARQALSDVELRHGQGLLWQVQRAGSMPSYLFGTMHSTDQNVVTLPAKVAEAFFSADSLSVEVIMTQSAQMQLALSMILSDGRTLEQIVGPTLFEKLAIVGATYGLQPAQLQRLKPWALTAMLSTPPSELARRRSGGVALDQMLQEEAKRRGIRIHQLETPEEQIATLEALFEEDQRSALQEVIDNNARVEEMFESMRRSYLAGDLNAFYDLMIEHTAGGDRALVESVLEGPIYARNERMVARMAERLRDGNAFIAVGALHLPGERGILHLLEQQGFAVRRLY